MEHAGQAPAFPDQERQMPDEQDPAAGQAGAAGPAPSVSLTDYEGGPSNGSFCIGGGPDSDISISDLSDDSAFHNHKKRKRSQAEAAARQPPPDNEMRRKLRGTAADSGDDAGRGGEPEQDGGSRASSQPPGLENGGGAPKVLERPVPKEREEQERAELQGSWEMAAVLDFLNLFRRELGLGNSFTWGELESALILSPGDQGVLCWLHITLLKGISTRADITPSNWTLYLSERLRQMWRSGGEPGQPPFAPARRRESMDYAALPTPDRVLALKALCEARLERDDIRSLIEDALRPLKAHKQAATAPDASPSLEEYRRSPLGEDSSGLVYWYFDVRLSDEGEGRFYRETPSSVGKPKGGVKGRGAAAAAPEPGTWELLGSDPETLTDLGHKLQRSKRREDRAIAAKILGDVVPGLMARRQEEERRARVAQRLHKQMGAVLLDPEGGYGRARRARKTVDYSGNAYDDIIRSAIRMQADHGRDPGSRRAAAALEPMMSAPEAAALGMRRGRSAYAAEDVPADSGVALERQLERQRAREGGRAQGSQPPSRAVSPSAEGSGGADPEGSSGADAFGKGSGGAEPGGVSGADPIGKGSGGAEPGGVSGADLFGKGSGGAEPEGISGADLFGKPTRRARSALPQRWNIPNRQQGGPLAHPAANGHRERGRYQNYSSGNEYQ